jgi:hypothetical protein
LTATPAASTPWHPMMICGHTSRSRNRYASWYRASSRAREPSISRRDKAAAISAGAGCYSSRTPPSGRAGFARPVWHCAVRAAPEDRLLSDEEWEQIAGDVMHRTGLAPYGQEDDAVRWVAVRHGGDHIHIVAMLARQDGGKPRLSIERYRARESCRAAEERYGLRSTAPGDRTAARRPTRAEREKSRRRGWREPPRVTLKRAVSTAAAGASSEQEFFVRLDGAGVPVRKRMGTHNPAEVTGYSVALPGDAAHGGGPVWFGGGRLAADMTLPKLRRRWGPARNAPAGRFSAPERNEIWEQAAHAASHAAAQIRSQAASSPRLPRRMPPGPPQTPCMRPPLRLAAESFAGRPTVTTVPRVLRTAGFPAPRKPATARARPRGSWPRSPLPRMTACLRW